MIDGRRRALPQLFQPIGEWPCARRIAGRPRANAPPSRRSRRNAALAPPAETGPFGLRIALRRGGGAGRGGAGSRALFVVDEWAARRGSARVWGGGKLA